MQVRVLGFLLGLGMTSVVSTANMALTVEKLERGFDPDRPLLIWAIGSGFTNGLGDGSAEVCIDGKPDDQVDAFYAGHILPDPKNAPAPPNPPRDRAPHMLTLGTNIGPQSWTLTMRSDVGDFELVGVTRTGFVEY
jgi:hypothetical protein